MTQRRFDIEIRADEEAMDKVTQTVETLRATLRELKGAWLEIKSQETINNWAG